VLFEWLEEDIRQACQDTLEAERQERVVDERAAGWQEPIWPQTTADVADAEQRLATTHGLLELRDHARAVVREQAERALEARHDETTPDDGSPT
jgi:hypothetical protein